MFLEHYFDRYTFQPEKGLAYGFEKSGTGYEYQCPVLSDSFLLKAPCLRPEDIFSGL